MRTLYVRNVPDEVAEGLEALASREGMSLNAFVVREDLSACDATYVALAETLGCARATVDARLARGPGVRCEIRSFAS